MAAFQNPELSHLEELRSELLRPGEFDLYTRNSHSVEFDNKPVKYDVFEPNVPIDDVPIIINNGYCAPAIVYDALAAGLAQNGRTVLRYSPPRSVSLGRMVVGGHVGNPLKKHAQAGWAVMKDSQRRYGFTEFDEIGHSMGTPISLMLAVAKPEAVRSVMCTGGAGLDGEGGLLVMSSKGIRLLKDEVFGERRQLGQLGRARLISREIGKHILSHPVDTLAEGYYVSRANATPSLIRVHNTGVRVGTILFENDTFFQPEKVLNHVGEHVDYSIVIPLAKHLHPQLHPFEHAQEQVAAFEALNNNPHKKHAA